MPLWDDLGKSISRDVPQHTYLGAIDAFSAFEHEFGRRELIKRLGRELLVEQARPGSTHDAFCRLRFRRVITTNFDFLLERGYETIGYPCDVVIEEEQLALPSDHRRTVVLKLHGDLRHPSRVVATEDDFDGFLTRHPVLATHLASLLIERVPVLIGYSLDDPDLRQVLAVLRERLGRMLPGAYALVVGADRSTVSRFERRGIKVINLPGKPKAYGEILAQAFRDLGHYWQSHVLDEAVFTEEGPLREIATAEGRDSRLCYFAVPLNRLPYYREEVFPIAEEAGMVPLSGFDVEVREGNLLAAAGALIAKSRLAVIDMTEGTGSVELGTALQALGHENVLVVASERTPTLSLTTGLLTLRVEDAEFSSSLTDGLARWFAAHSPPSSLAETEARTLLDLKQWRAALIAAMADLERELVAWAGGSYREGIQRVRPSRPTLGRLLRDQSFEIDESLRHRLLEWLMLRNRALHERAPVTQQQALEAVADVERLRAQLR
jgi:SIR2-like domain